MARSVVWTLARRFLLSKTSDQFLSFIAWISTAGVALGVLSLTIVTSVINGFEGELIRVITGLQGDVVLYTSGEPVSGVQKIFDKIQSTAPEVIARTPSHIVPLMVAGPAGVAGAIWEGVDNESLGTVTELPDRVTEGRMPTGPGEVALGSALADRIGAKPGMDVRLVSPTAGDASGGLVAPRAVVVQVVGIIRLGMYQYDSKFFFSTLPYLQEFVQQPGTITNVKLKLRRGTDAEAVAARLNEAFGFPFKAKDWGQLNHNILYSIRLEKVVISILLTVIVIVAAFNVVSTLVMMIHDKTKEIAILKTMGFRPIQAFRLFMSVGGGIGLVGVSVGVALGLGLAWVLKMTHWVKLPADIYHIGFLPVWIDGREVLLIAIMSLLITLVGSVFPAYRVAQRPPLEGIRYD